MPHHVDHDVILDRLAATRGGVRNVFDNIDTGRTAHVIIDMQNGFMEEGAPVEVPEARGIVSHINRISDAMRSAGGRNYFVRYTTPDDIDQSWPLMLMRMGSQAETHKQAFAVGSHYWQLWPALEVQDGDRIVDKARFSAFTPDTSDLHEILQADGIDTLVITGTLTNVCCESTARDAMQRNYRVIIVADANAALSDAAHAATLESLGMVFADIRSVEEIEAMLAAAVR
jgi:ureidoacrylate peracid hydrolase